MKYLRLIVLGCFSAGMALAAPAVPDQSTDQLLNRVKILESQLETIHAELAALRPEAVVAAKPVAKKSKDLKGKHCPRHVKKQCASKHCPVKHTAATSAIAHPVWMSPVFGQHTLYDTSNLIINYPGIYKDVALLRERQAWAASMGKRGIASPLIELSGKLESQMYSVHDYGQTRTDIDLTGAELDFSININDWTSAFMSMSYDNGWTPLFMPSMVADLTRVRGSTVRLDKGFITVGNLNVSPAYFSIGQMVLPYGRFSSAMISGPLGMSLAQTKARAVVFGFEPRQACSHTYGSMFVFSSETGRENSLALQLKRFGADVGVRGHAGDWNVDMGASYISNVTDSNIFEPRFAPVPVDDDAIVLRHAVPGLSLHSVLSSGPVTLTAEYNGVLRSFHFDNLAHEGEGASPRAYMLEWAYHFPVKGHPSLVAVGYQWTKETEALALPKKRYLAAFSTALMHNTNFSMEYRHDKGYSHGLVPAEPSLPDSEADAFFFKLGVYF